MDEFQETLLAKLANIEFLLTRIVNNTAKDGPFISMTTGVITHGTGTSGAQPYDPNKDPTLQGANGGY